MEEIYCAHCRATLSAPTARCPRCGSLAVMVTEPSERSSVGYVAGFVAMLLLVLLAAWLRY